MATEERVGAPGTVNLVEGLIELLETERSALDALSLASELLDEEPRIAFEQAQREIVRICSALHSCLKRRGVEPTGGRGDLARGIAREQRVERRLRLLRLGLEWILTRTDAMLSSLIPTDVRVCVGEIGRLHCGHVELCDRALAPANSGSDRVQCGPGDARIR